MRQACLWRNTKLHYLPPPLLRRRTIRYGRRDPLCALPLQVILIILDFVRGIVFFSMNLRARFPDLSLKPGANARAAAHICSRTGSTELALQVCTVAYLISD